MLLPALIRRIHEAKVRGQETVEIWGSGRPCREFLHVDDLADACILAMQRYEDPTPINIGTGSDVSVADLALLVAEAVGYKGAFALTRADRTALHGSCSMSGGSRVWGGKLESTWRADPDYLPLVA